jgi:hypothetical protein
MRSGLLSDLRDEIVAAVTAAQPLPVYRVLPGGNVDPPAVVIGTFELEPNDETAQVTDITFPVSIVGSKADMDPTQAAFDDQGGDLWTALDGLKVTAGTDPFLISCDYARAAQRLFGESQPVLTFECRTSHLNC